MSWVTRHPQGWVCRTLELLLTILEYSKKSQPVLRVQAKVLGTTSLRRRAILASDRVARHRISGPRLHADHGPDHGQVNFE